MYQDPKVRRAYLYMFTSQKLSQNKLSKKEFAQIYFNFRVLCSTNTDQCNKRKALIDISLSTNNIDSGSTSSILISPDIQNKEKTASHK